MSDLEHVFKHINLHLNTIWPDAKRVVAGGAVRDFLLNKNPKDIDVYVAYSSKMRVLLDLRTIFPRVEQNPTAYQDLGQEFLHVLDVPNVLGYPVQIMIMKYNMSFSNDYDFGRRLVQDFDFGINQAFWTDTAGFYTTEEYEDDADNKTFTLRNVRSPRQLEKLVDKYKRLRVLKYPEYNLTYKSDAFKNGT